MMLTNKQTLILSGLLTAAFFIGGLLDILDNFIMLTLITLMFFTIVINVFKSGFSKRNQDLED
ncbi:hypothetical protein [Neotamlana laminarinivorans]|uniref:Uncharacterized protein n=1 Tax=Neotamlana laminarinivorans TaxID=2883124 RepID=A0A9X1I2H5_9FLAO|nr:hypothetical protein [Tamlana laminarinivorans]MCB4798774.1 hypothetical protein [Tamlana laminarinivorans]